MDLPSPKWEPRSGAIPPVMTIGSSTLGLYGRRRIDHIALNEDWKAEALEVISNIHGESKLPDHFGVVADLSVLSLRKRRRCCYRPLSRTGAERRPDRIQTKSSQRTNFPQHRGAGTSPRAQPLTESKYVLAVRV